MSWFSRLTNALNPRRLDEALPDEMADHLERRAATLNDKGLNAEEARRQAYVRFGNTTLLREESRGIRLWAGLEGTLQDVRYSWRGIRKGPAFAGTAVLSLGLAIGANTAIYSILDAAILRSLPVSKPEQLFTLSWPDTSDAGSPAGQERDSFSYPEYLRYVSVTKPSARLALFSSPDRVEAQGPNPDAPIEKLNKAFISGEGFDFLGVRPAVGRLFSAEEDHIPQSRAVAVLSYDYWHRSFQEDPAALGRNLKIDGKTYEITGVTRKGFFGVEPGKFVDVWVPGTLYDPQALTNSGFHWFRILGRFTQGISAGQVQTVLQPSFHDFQVQRVKQFPTMPTAIRRQFLQSAIRVHPAAAGVSNFRKTFSRPLWIVFGVAAGILLIACANVASLLLARATARNRNGDAGLAGCGKNAPRPADVDGKPHAFSYGRWVGLVTRARGSTFARKPACDRGRSSAVRPVNRYSRDVVLCRSFNGVSGAFWIGSGVASVRRAADAFVTRFLWAGWETPPGKGLRELSSRLCVLLSPSWCRVSVQSGQLAASEPRVR